MRPAALLALVLAAPAVAQPGDEGATGALLVTVLDEETRQPLSGAHVRVGDAVGVVAANGRVRFVEVPVGDVAVSVSHVGYVTRDTAAVVTGAPLSRLLVRLAPESTALPTVAVEETAYNEGMLRRRGFYERQSSRTGVFLTREELDERGATLFSDVFSQVPGVRVQRRSGQTALVSSRSQDCPMAIFVDGVEAAYLAERVDSVPFRDIAAVEVYRGPAEVPMEYAYTRSRETCGAVLVWTRVSVN